MGYYSDPTAAQALGNINREFSKREKKAKQLLKRLDRQHARYYNFYTSRKWGHANNYDLCLNTASFGIDGTVDFIYKMIEKK